MLIRADARSLPLRDGCVDCVVTSPPYFGLRDYGNPQQIGLEATPDAYVASLVAVFREVRRVLSDGGTVWLNLGDSYSAHAGQRKTTDVAGIKQQSNVASIGAPSRCVAEIGAKNLIGIPWRVAFALQADGWYLRSDIIWSKPNPMPESVTDRPTKAHEYLFLLAKSERYHYDAAAIREPYAESTLRQASDGYGGQGQKDYEAAGVQNPSDAKRRIIESVRRRQEQGLVEGSSSERRYTGFNDRYRADANLGTGRNKRTVWTVNTQPYAGAHFATMPEMLVEPCILAGCPLGGLVLDPFLGSGTVGAVAERLGRRWVGTDLSYQPLAKKRTAQRGIRFEQEIA